MKEEANIITTKKDKKDFQVIDIEEKVKPKNTTPNQNKAAMTTPPKVLKTERIDSPPEISTERTVTTVQCK